MDDAWVVRVNTIVEGAFPWAFRILKSHWYASLIAIVLIGWASAPSIALHFGQRYLGPTSQVGATVSPASAEQKAAIEISQLGQLGDSFGIFNSLMSSLLFIAAGATFWLQNMQLRKANEERHSDEIFRQRERAEETLFKLLELHRDVKDKIFYDTSSGNAALVKCVIGAMRNLYQVSYMPQDKFIKCTEHILDSYVQKCLGPYFRSLFQLYKHIDSVDVWGEASEKKFYSSMVRSQMSQAEFYLLLLNYDSYWGRDFDEKVCKYNLLKHLSFSPLDPCTRYLIKRVAQNALGDNERLLNLYLEPYSAEQFCVDAVEIRREHRILESQLKDISMHM